MSPFQLGVQYIGGLIAFLILAFTSLYSAYLLAAQFIRTTHSHLRIAGALVVEYWILTALFALVIPFHCFRLWTCLPLLFIAAALTHARLYHKLRNLLIYDLNRAKQLWVNAINSRLVLFIVSGFMIIFVRFLRGLVAPPMGWDSLTYHLLKAGRWVQSGGFQPENAPDAWGYYEYTPIIGDILWAWAMLPFNGDAMIGAAGVMIWVTCVTGAYALARQLRVDKLNALWAALLIGYIPAVMNFVTSGYVDNTSLALFLLSCSLLVSSWKTKNAATSILALAALSLATGTRISFVPILVITGLLTTWLLFRWSSSVRDFIANLAAATLAICVPCFFYIYTWYKTGNVLYPLHVNFLGRRIFEGNEEFMVVVYGINHANPPSPTMADYSYFLDKLLFSAPTYEHLNLTFLAPVMLFLGAIGGVALFRSATLPLKYALSFLLSVSFIIFYLLLSPNTTHYRNTWPETMGRFLTPAYSMFIIMTAFVAQSRVIRATLAVFSVVHLVSSVPLGMGDVDNKAILLLLLFAIPLFITGGVYRYGPVVIKERRFGAPALILSALIFFGGLGYARDKYRYAYYDSVPETYDVHRMAWNLTPSRLWWFLDRPHQPLNIAPTAGFSLRGHNWFRYPYLGRRLQNHVAYVPVTSDGSVFDYLLLRRDGINPASRGDFAAWYQRLLNQKVDYVACSGPFSFEVGWMEKRKDLFERAFVDPRQLGLAYRVKANFRTEGELGASPK